MFRTVEWTDKGIVILDQTRLPGELVYITLQTVEETAEAIRTLRVRGAPLIGVVAALGMALAAHRFKGQPGELAGYLCEAYEKLLATRPTAVNLQWALTRMMECYRRNQGAALEEVQRALLAEALAIQQEDMETNRRIGDYGEKLVRPEARILTICNAGALATAGYGTALGVIRAAHRAGKIKNVWACETRPVLQGARLTVWELHQDGIPVTLLTDSMAGYLMRRGKVDAVIVGADRIAANGDTANKIGTYTLAVLAEHHEIPFYVAAPWSTVDLTVDDGEQIPIEFRDPREVREIGGCLTTIPDVPVFNPAFDVTPHRLISAIITERGIIEPPYRENLQAIAGTGNT